MRPFLSRLKDSLAFRATVTLMIVQTIPVLTFLYLIARNSLPEDIAQNDFGIIAVEGIYLRMNGFASPEQLFWARSYEQEFSIIERRTYSEEQKRDRKFWEYIVEENPNLWYYVSAPNLLESHGNQPVLKTHAERFVDPETKSGGDCQSARFYLTERQSDATAFIRRCGDKTFYMEFGGLSDSFIPNKSFLEDMPTLYSFVDFLYQFLVLLLIFIATPVAIFLYTRPIQKAAAAAEKVGYRRQHNELPTQGVFSEVRGFIDAINKALRRIDISVRREKYFRDAIAHELRTPMSLLRAKFEYIEDGELRESLISDLGDIVKLLDRILVFSKTALDEDPTLPVDIVEVAREACASCGVLAIEKDLEINFNCPDIRRPQKVINRTALFLVLVNLINNAIKHSQSEAPLDVSVNENGKIIIADYGIGINAMHLSILNGYTDFDIENFERRGNGIGLLIVAELIKFSGIKVRATSQRGQGTRIEIMCQ